MKVLTQVADKNIAYDAVSTYRIIVIVTALGTFDFEKDNLYTLVGFWLQQYRSGQGFFSMDYKLKVKVVIVKAYFTSDPFGDSA